MVEFHTDQFVLWVDECAESGEGDARTATVSGAVVLPGSPPVGWEFEIISPLGADASLCIYPPNWGGDESDACYRSQIIEAFPVGDVHRNRITRDAIRKAVLQLVGRGIGGALAPLPIPRLATEHIEPLWVLDHEELGDAETRLRHIMEAEVRAGIDACIAEGDEGEEEGWQ